MPSLFKEIFQLAFRRFVKDRGRFPTPAERDMIQDMAQKEAKKQMEMIDPVFKGTPKMDPDRPFMGFKPKVVPKEGELSVTIEGQTKNMTPEGIMNFLMGKGKAKDTNIGKAPKTTAETKKKKSMIDPKLTEEENIKRMMEENKKAVKRFEEKFGKKDREDFNIGGGAGLPAATGGQSVFIGPTLPEEEEEEVIVQEPDDEEQTDPLAYMLNTGLQPIFPMPQMQKVPTEGGVGELREFLKSRGAQELGVGFNFPTKGGGILGVGVAPSGNVGAKFLQRFEEGGPVDPDRRTFVKILGGLASIPILGKFVAPFKQAAPVVAETAKEVPAYFFKLVDKIRRLGDDAPGLTSIERESGKRYKNYEMVEDQTTGDIIIKKQKQGSTMVGDDMVEGTMSEEVLAYRTPKNTPEGRLSADYEEITVRPDFEGKMRDVEDGLDSMNEILEEVGETQLKKAGGGLAYMLGE